MAELIVDFPECRKSSIDMIETKRQKVQFCEQTSVAYFERHNKTDSVKLWYSSQDYDIMKIESQEAIFVQRRVITSNIVLAEINGVEKFLNPRTCKEAQRNKSRCRRAVLREQDLQYCAEVDDPWKLARVSAYHSKWAAEQAHSAR